MMNIKSRVKGLASMASEAISQATEIMAPMLYKSSEDEVQMRWLRFLSMAQKAIDVGQSLYDEKVLGKFSEQLDRIVAILAGEKGVLDVKVCLHHVLENKMIGQLCHVGMKDNPKGMMALSLNFVSDLLNNVDTHDMLPTMSVYEPLQELIQRASEMETEDKVIREKLLLVLHTIWKVLHRDACQLAFFWKMDELKIFTLLLPHMFSMHKHGQYAREAILLAIGMQDEKLNGFMVKNTCCVQELVQEWGAIFKAIPKNGKTNSATTQVLQMYIAFGGAMVMAAEHSVRKCILDQIDDTFLNTMVRPAILNTSIIVARNATIYMQYMIKGLMQSGAACAENPLLAALVAFMFEKQIWTEIVHRIDAISEDVVIENLNLINVMLDMNDEHVYQKLSSHHPPQYHTVVHNGSLTEFVHAFHGPCSRLEKFLKANQPLHPQSVQHETICRSVACANWKTLGTNGLSKTLYSDKKNSTKKQVDIHEPCSKDTSDQSRPPETASDTLSRLESSEKVADGLNTIQCIFNRMKRFTECSVSTNLALTGVLANLAQCPHPKIHGLIYGKHESSLRHILVKIWTSMLNRIDEIPNGQEELASIRMQLMEYGLDGIDAAYQASTSHFEFFRTVVLFEEFLSEIASILQAKSILHQVPLEPEGYYMCPQRDTRHQHFEKPKQATIEESKTTKSASEMLDTITTQLELDSI